MLNEAVAKELQEENLEALARNPKGFQFTETFFPYTSGEIGPYYVQSGAVMANGRDYVNAIRHMAFMIEQTMPEGTLGGLSCSDTDYVISGGETRDWIFSNPVAFQLGLSPTMIYKDGKIVGAGMKGKKVLHVADLNNEGSSMRDYWVPAIKKTGGTIEHYFCYVDRLEDGVKIIERDLGLQRHALVPLDEHAWDYLKSELGIVSTEVYKNLRERMEDKDAWARKMLRSDAGLKTLGSLLNSPDKKTKEKGWKVIEKGYPDMKDEILDWFKQNWYTFER